MERSTVLSRFEGFLAVWTNRCLTSDRCTANVAVLGRMILGHAQVDAQEFLASCEANYLEGSDAH